MSAFSRVGIWLLFLVGAYLLSLAVVSLCDVLILANVQKLFNRLFMNRKADNKLIKTGDS